MFDKMAIKDKDFSIELPLIISKLALVAEVVRLYPLCPEVNHELEDIHLSGVCAVLLEIESDLRKINKALYEPVKEYVCIRESTEKAA